MDELKYVCEIWSCKLHADAPGTSHLRHFKTIEEAQGYVEKQYLRATDGLQIFGLEKGRDFVCNFNMKSPLFFAFVYVDALHMVTSWKISKLKKGENDEKGN